MKKSHMSKGNIILYRGCLMRDVGKLISFNFNICSECNHIHRENILYQRFPWCASAIWWWQAMSGSRSHHIINKLPCGDSSVVNMFERSNSQFLAAAVYEFMRIWAYGGEATLNLSTISGLAKVNLSCTLGNPDAVFSSSSTSAPFSPPTYPSQQTWHRGPSERKRNNLWAARHQGAN